MNVLVIAAHPDDEVLGCGGTIARLAREGASIQVAILGEGATSRHAARGASDPAEIEALRTCSRKAADILGAKSVSHFRFPDNRFDSVDLLDIIKTIEMVADKFKPTWVFTQHGGDLNIDHALVFKATLTAFRPTQESAIEAIYAYEIPSSTEWSFQRFEPPFRPSVFFDIQPTLELKIRAMDAYETETRVFPHPRSPEALRCIAQRWGSVVGLHAAEAFELIRDVRKHFQHQGA